MSQTTFKIGDRVIYRYAAKEFLGTIVKELSLDGFITVEFDNPEWKTHDCEGAVPSGRGYWVMPLSCKLAEEQKGLAIINLRGVRKEDDEYQTTPDGFKTNPENWKPGKWLI